MNRAVAHHDEGVPAPGRPAGDDGDDDLRHRPDQPLHLEDVQPARPLGVDLLATLGDTRVRVGVVGLVPVAVRPAHALVAAGAERPAAVLRGRPVPCEDDGPDVGRQPRVVQRAVELVDRPRPERVADLRAVERDADDRQVALDVPRPVHAAVVGDVGAVPALDLPPPGRVERLGHVSFRTHRPNVARGRRRMRDGSAAPRGYA
jgi:hypothetical protein